MEILSLLPSAGPLGRMRSRFIKSKLGRCGRSLGISQHVIIKFAGRVEIGHNVFINRGALITARDRISIGDNTLIGPYVVINSGDHIFADRLRPIHHQGHIVSPIFIAEDVWIGANATILRGVTIGRGSVIGAGAVVTSDVPEYSVAVGVPAKVIRRRGAE